MMSAVFAAAVTVAFLFYKGHCALPCATQDFGIAYNGVKVFTVSSTNDTCSCLNFASPGLAVLASAEIETLRLGTLRGGSGGVQLPAGTILDLGFNSSGREANAGKIGYGAFGLPDTLNIVGAGSTAGSRQVKLLDVAQVGSLVSIGGTYTCGGLEGTYYQGVTLDEPPTCTRPSDPVFLHWYGSGPCSSCGPDIGCSRFSVRYSGYLLAPVTGNVTLVVTSDDGVRLWWNNAQRPTIDAWATQNSSSFQSSVMVVAGEYYPIRIEYFQDVATYQLVLQWFYGAQPAVSIPTSNLCTASGVQVGAGHSVFKGPVTFDAAAMFSKGVGSAATTTEVNGPLKVTGLLTANTGVTVPTGRSVELQGTTTLSVTGMSTLGPVSSGSVNVAGSMTTSGLTTANGGIAVPTGQAVVIGGTSSLTVGGLIAATGGLTVPTGQALSIQGTGTLAVSGLSNLGVVNSGSHNISGVLTVSGLTAANGGITVPTGQAVAIQGTSTLDVGGRVTASGGVTVPTGQTVALQGSTTLTVAGTSTLGVTNTGDLTAIGGLSVAGSTTLNGGLMVPSGQAVAIQGTSVLAVGGRITALGGMTVASGQSLTVVGTGTFSVGGPTSLGYTTIGTGSVSGSLDVSGLITATGGISVPSGAMIVVSGTSVLTVQGVTTLATVNTGNLGVTGTVTASGAIAANGGINVPTGKDINIAGTGTLNVAGTSTLGVVNSGNLGITGTLTVSGTSTLNGAVNIPSQPLTLGSAGLRTAYGTPLDVAYGFASREVSAGKIGYQLYTLEGSGDGYSLSLATDLSGSDLGSSITGITSMDACYAQCAATVSASGLMCGSLR
eukprot:TRINITY_DN5941_c0_g1_i3.p1 TRINITY_DN5941_c0_g1~~TRINITY_DN5941_c0_g1_i3.p1  ORF type:complete len:832 (+),score=237.79 TRINITY_DN5941_c0_g1_i3:138-2633(+)